MSHFLKFGGVLVLNLYDDLITKYRTVTVSIIYSELRGWSCMKLHYLVRLHWALGRRIYTIQPPTKSFQELLGFGISNIKPVINMADKTSTPDPAAPIPTVETLPELYVDLAEIVKLHPESNINESNVEASFGLSTKDATERLTKYGKNVLTPPKRTPSWLLLLRQFQNTFLILLNASAALSVVAYIIAGDITNLYLGIVLFVVVFITGYAQFHEESKAFSIIDSFSQMLGKLILSFPFKKTHFCSPHSP